MVKKKRMGCAIIQAHAYVLIDPSPCNFLDTIYRSFEAPESPPLLFSTPPEAASTQLAQHQVLTFFPNWDHLVSF